ncbi:GNAT family N-acetyltransferase [Streptomyces sp. NPDC021749]|uniref:GNAT family N-acetyltransferase n=1 Tax=Streptomyces sp. NPDC021749 TaxID=3154905 RepID=UPI003401C778
MTEPRRAVAADAGELGRMRAALVEDVGPWNLRLIQFFRENVESDRMAAFVVDRPGGLAACASGTVTRSVPGPDHEGVVGYIHTVYTDPEYRRRGYGRAVTQALMDWLAECGCTLLTLNASDEGEPMYRALGFGVNRRAMRLIRVASHRG